MIASKESSNISPSKNRVDFMFTTSFFGNNKNSENHDCERLGGWGMLETRVVNDMTTVDHEVNEMVSGGCVNEHIY